MYQAVLVDADIDEANAATLVHHALQDHAGREIVEGLAPFLEHGSLENFGLPTVTDIFRELEKPGRDPRPVSSTNVCGVSRRHQARATVWSR